MTRGDWARVYLWNGRSGAYSEGAKKRGSGKRCTRPGASDPPNDATEGRALVMMVSPDPDSKSNSPDQYPCYCLPGAARCDDPYNWCDRTERTERLLRAVLRDGRPATAEQRARFRPGGHV